jgi:HK97 family phage portal protein
MRFRTRPPPLPAQLLPATEVRDPTAATRTLRWTSPGQPQVSDWDATRAIGLAYYGNVFVYRCVECIAADVASLPIRVGPDPDRADDYNPKAPMAVKLAQAPPGGPAPGIAARKLWAWSTAQRAVTGKMAWEIERDARERPLAFWPLPGGMLDAVPSTSGTAYFQAFKFGPMGKQRILRPDQVYYAWRPGQTDWRQPESVLQSARLPVSVAVMMDRYNYAFLRNDARPAAVVVHQAFAEREERDAWRGNFLAEHEGPDQAGKPVFVEVDSEDGNVSTMLDVKTLGLSQRDARFVELYAGTIRAITVAFGVPLSRLGDASERTFSNAGEEMDMYWGSTIPGWTTELADDVNISLAPQFGDDLVMWFDFSRQTKGRTRVFASASPVDLVAAAIVTPDEVRHDLGLAPMPELPAAPTTPPVPEPVPAPALVPAVASAPSPEARTLQALERVWVSQIRALFERQAETTLSRLTGRRGHTATRRTAPDASAVFDQPFWERQTTNLALGLIAAVYDMAGATLSIDVPASVATRATTLAASVTGATHAAIRAELERGGSIADLATRVRGVFGDATQVRAPAIAREHVHAAFEEAKLANDSGPAQKPLQRQNGHRTLPVGEAERRLVLVHLGKMDPEGMTA